MSKSPEQELYDEIYKKALELGVDVYQHSPDESAAYPFIKLSNTQLVPTATKSYLLGTIHVDFDVWGDAGSRKVVSDLANSLLKAISKIRVLPSGLKVTMQFDVTSTEIMTDTSTTSDLWRARCLTRYALV